MNDPFQHIFNQASEHGLRLSSLSQNETGVFKAKWRRDYAGGCDFAEAVSATDPFHALKDSLCVAIKTLPVATPVAVVVEDDLFGGL